MSSRDPLAIPVRHVVIGKANPDRANGINVIAHNLATTGAGLGQDVEIWGIAPDHGESDAARGYRLRLFGRSRFRFRLDPRLRQAIASTASGTVFHLHGTLLPEFFLVTRRLQAAGLRWIVSPHGAYSAASLKKNRLVKRLFLAMFDRFTVGNAAAIHLMIDHEADAVRALLTLPPALVVPNGQGMPTGEAPARSRNPEPLFGFVGRIAMRHKGLDLLLDGFAGYRRSGGRGELWLIGDGADRPAAERQAAALGLGDTVRFLGARFGTEKLELMRQMDLFVHPSRWEGMPMAALEAAALALPLLVSEETNLAGNVARADAGMVLPELSATAIAALLGRADAAHRDGRLERLGANAAAMIRADFTWDRAVRKLADGYLRFAV